MAGVQAAGGDTGTGARLPVLDGPSGTAAHPYPRSDALWRGRHATANLADVLHLLCVVHGRHPGVIDYAAEQLAGLPAFDWIGQAAIAFAEERAYLARLAAEAGPVPSTPGQAECEAALKGQRHAIEMLARSERIGCAAGCAAALVLDWSAVRTLFDTAAERLGIRPAPALLPEPHQVREAMSAIAAEPAVARAITFGADQLFVQQTCLWDLIESRRASRDPA
jgi:hypothetical protein